MSTGNKAGRHALLLNAATNWAGFAAQVVVALFMAPILVHGLKDQRYGIWSLVESVLAYLMLFDLGVGASVVRYVAKYEVGQDHRSLNRVFSTSLCIFAAAGGAALLVAAGLAIIGSRFVTIPADLLREARREKHAAVLQAQRDRSPVLRMRRFLEEALSAPLRRGESHTSRPAHRAT